MITQSARILLAKGEGQVAFVRRLLNTSFSKQAACAGEISAFCKDVPHGHARIIRCLQVLLVSAPCSQILSQDSQSRVCDLILLIKSHKPSDLHRAVPQLRVQTKPSCMFWLDRTTWTTQQWAGSAETRSLPTQSDLQQITGAAE